MTRTILGVLLGGLLLVPTLAVASPGTDRVDPDALKNGRLDPTPDPDLFHCGVGGATSLLAGAVVVGMLVRRRRAAPR